MTPTSTRDHYQTLQVTRDADPEVIERAYKALSLKHHPDRVSAGERPAATERMRAINRAYEVLKDPAERRRYDRTLPSEGGKAWELFLEKGLVGLFRERSRSNGS